MDTPPPHVAEFYRHVKTLGREAIAELPQYIKPTDHRDCPLLHFNYYGEPQNYWDTQEVFFDFTNRCSWWPWCPQAPESIRHVHSIAPGGGWEVQGYPGLYVYPGLFKHYGAKLKLVDMILHDELSNDATLTNLHEKHHVDCISNADGTRASFFDPIASELKFEPRLNETWDNSPLSMRGFIQNLRWIKFGRLPDEIKKVMDNILRLSATFRSGTAYLSSRDHSTELRQQIEDRPSFHVALGCDAIFIVGGDTGSREAESFQNTNESLRSHRCDNEFSGDKDVLQSLDGSSSENTDDTRYETDKSTNAHPQKVTSDSPPVAIHLRDGDALLFTGLSRRAWHGVAKVFEETTPAWGEDWPCSRHETSSDQARQGWKGCMRSRMIDLVIT